MTMKRAISVILAFCLMLGLLSFAAAETDTSTTAGVDVVIVLDMTNSMYPMKDYSGKETNTGNDPNSYRVDATGASTELITSNVVSIENLDLLVVLRLFDAVCPAYAQLKESCTCFYIQLSFFFANDRRFRRIERFNLDYRFDLGSSYDSLLLCLFFGFILRTGYKKRGEYQDRYHENSF